MLTVRIDEIRSHLHQGGRRLQEAESHIQAGGNTSGYVKFTLSKEMMPDSFNCTDRMKFSDWEFKMLNFLSAGDHEHAGDILERTTQEQEDVAEDQFDMIAVQRGWVGQAREHTRFAKYLCIVLRNRTDGTPHRLVRNERHKDTVNAWKRLHMEYVPVTSATAQGCHEEITGNSSSKDNIRRKQRNLNA